MRVGRRRARLLSQPGVTGGAFPCVRDALCATDPFAGRRPGLCRGLGGRWAVVRASPLPLTASPFCVRLAAAAWGAGPGVALPELLVVPPFPLTRLGCASSFCVPPGVLRGLAVVLGLRVGLGGRLCALRGLPVPFGASVGILPRLSYGEVTDMDRSSCPGFASACPGFASAWRHCNFLLLFTRFFFLKKKRGMHPGRMCVISVPHRTLDCWYMGSTETGISRQ